MTRLLIFDFDGLILDTEAPAYESWQHVYEAHGRHLEFATWATCIGTDDTFDPHALLEARLGHALDRTEVQARRRARFAELIARQDIRPGVRDYVAEARRLGLRLAVASSSSRDWVAGHLDRFGLLECFDVLRCAGDVARVKPDPALYRAVLTALEVGPGEAVAFEDSPNGIRAARAAGIFCVAVPNPLTADLDLGHADLRLRSLAELSLPSLLARVAR